jgi:DNA-binding NarL/FixJ family response regulator
MTIRVLIVDDQTMVRVGLRMILDAQTDIDVVGESADGNEAIRDAQRLLPDVVLMDIRMPGLDGIAATRSITGPAAHATKVVILTTYDLDEYLFDALEAGASGFLLKDVRPEELIQAVRAVAAGGALLSPSATRTLIATFAGRQRRLPSPPPEMQTLTQRELEVLELIGRGLNNAAIASALFISDNTVKTHITRIFDKLDARDRVQAVIIAYDAGLVSPGDQNPSPSVPPASRTTPAKRP